VVRFIISSLGKRVAQRATNVLSSCFIEMENSMLFSIGVLNIKVSKPFSNEISSMKSSSNEMSLGQSSNIRFTFTRDIVVYKIATWNLEMT
jgi:hypothetical protein